MSQRELPRYDGDFMIQLADLMDRKRLLIFDFDGTIADTTPIHERAFTEVLGPLGVPVDYSSIAGLKTIDALKACLSAAGCLELEFDLPALVAQKQRRARELIANELRPLPGMEAFLCWARSHFRLALVTSGSRVTIDLALEKLGYTNWFDPVICAEDVIRTKPAPDGFLKALRLGNFDAEDALVLEDAESGFRAASAAGLSFVDVTAVDWGLEIKRLRA